MSSTGNVARGLKATIHNDNVSEEAKQSAAQRLEQMGVEVPSDYKAPTGGAMDVDPSLPTGGVGKNTVPTAGADDEYSSDFISTNQMRGTKFTSLEDKEIQGAEYARQVLDGETQEFEAAFTPDEDGISRTSYVDDDEPISTGQKDASQNRRLGGYKATLKNPNVSQGAKEHAREVLEDAGAIN